MPSHVSNAQAMYASFVALCRVALLVKATAFEDVEAHRWVFDAEGRVARFRHFVDTHGMVLAAGL